MVDTPDGAARWERQIQVRLVRGEAAALGELYDRHARFVHAVAARLAGEERAAGDLVVRVFAQLWERPQEFDPERCRLRTWLASSACELARQQRTLADSTSSQPPRPDVPATGVPADTAGLAQVACLAAVLSSMSSGMRSALHLVHTGNMNYRQAAAKLDISEQEAARRLRVGLQLIADASGAAREEDRR
ncbi:sigma-70 family RNA polymerase sigma factor [Streptomyces sp. XM4193]|uniref:RNA polymerase sigma factor n=1 Tax=Streptomyces sp. XM4193 TaxID=2929782 RepID=UPI001FFB7564|nr:sigma-70 family RNA polymerase sigma factor [Streptomyces sp. XM4193]MCK1799126.1 sigma-70 family RNA polymerase sigma factor [Streptomyces sp. XM4193]